VNATTHIGQPCTYRGGLYTYRASWGGLLKLDKGAADLA
jgi:hypothetical protein